MDLIGEIAESQSFGLVAPHQSKSYIRCGPNDGPQKRGHSVRKTPASVTRTTPTPSICKCEESWSWSTVNKSHEVQIQDEAGATVLFHPNWSNGTAGVRGNLVLNGGVHYWEIKLSNRVFGTSMMFGVGTDRSCLHVDAFVDLLGKDGNSMGVSHKGLAWYNGVWKQYTKPFRENESTTIGMLFNWFTGTLTYYQDGKSLGVAFTGLNRFKENLYPIACSTAAKTEMTVRNCRRSYTSLQDRCRRVILDSLKHSSNVINIIQELPIPRDSKDFILDEVDCMDTSMLE